MFLTSVIRNELYSTKWDSVMIMIMIILQSIGTVPLKKRENQSNAVNINHGQLIICGTVGWADCVLLILAAKT